MGCGSRLLLLLLLLGVVDFVTRLVWWDESRDGYIYDWMNWMNTIPGHEYAADGGGKAISGLLGWEHLMTRACRRFKAKQKHTGWPFSCCVEILWILIMPDSRPGKQNLYGHMHLPKFQSKPRVMR